MNFQTAFNAPGQYITMRGIPTKYDMKTGQYGLYALGDLVDDAGQSIQVLFSGSKKVPLPQQSLLNVPCLWSVQYDANKQQTKAFFQQYANGQQQARQPAPQQAPPQPQGPPPVNAGRDTGVSIERQCIVKGVCEIVARSGGQMGIDDALDWCDALHGWIKTGNVPPREPEPMGDEPPF